MEKNTQGKKTERGKPCIYQTEKQKRDTGRERDPYVTLMEVLPHGEWWGRVLHEHVVRDVPPHLQIRASSSLSPGFSTEAPFVYSAGQASMLDFPGHDKRFAFPRTHPLAVRWTPRSLCQPATASDVSTCPQSERQCRWLRTKEVQPYYFADNERTLERTEFEMVLQPLIFGVTSAGWTPRVSVVSIHCTW